MSQYPNVRLVVRPIELKTANAFVDSLHRHHKPVTGHRFSIGTFDGHKSLRGVAICGRPVARSCDPLEVLEVTRSCTDGCFNACSKLYGAAARVAKELGYRVIQTYILDEEQGISLKAAGWERVGEVKGRSWDTPSRRRVDSHPTTDKTRWEKVLRPYDEWIEMEIAA